MSTRRRAEYKLHYFNLKGRGELIRLILAYAKVPYDDIRYTEQEWLPLKDKMPYNQLPVLEYRGQYLAQSLTIARFLARRHNLAGSDEWQAARIDSFLDLLGDTLNEAVPVFMAGEDQEKRQAATENFFKKGIEPFFKQCEKLLNSNGNVYLFGNQLSVADLALFGFYDLFSGVFGADRIPKSQHVVALHARVAEIPTIRSWIEKRPVTPH